MSKTYNIGLALSGGGAKGIAHAGVLKALEEKSLKVDIISGVSAGGIIGALYADGYSPEEIKEFLKENTLYKMVGFLNWPKKGGLVNMEKYKRVVGKKLHAKTFDQLQIPLVLNATELNAGKNVYFRDGNLLDAIIASASVPIFFNPVLINGKQYVDGGIFCNLPASVLRDDCEVLIGVHVNPTCDKTNCNGVLEVAERIFHLAVNGNTRGQKSKCDIVIETSKVKKYGMFDVSKSDEIFEIGYEYAMKALDKFDFASHGITIK